MSIKRCDQCEEELIKCYVDQGLKGILVKNHEGDKVLGNKKNTRVNPYICGNCGYTVWYADEPSKLR